MAANQGFNRRKVDGASTARCVMVASCKRGRQTVSLRALFPNDFVAQGGIGFVGYCLLGFVC
jgi:hypothetical protein